MIKNILLVGLGGGIGSIARYLCQRWFMMNQIQVFPWGTFTVNAVGCFLIGIFWGLSYRFYESNESFSLFLMAGLCGGFTTFSAFTLEGIGLMKEHKPVMFFTYIAGSVLVGLFATFLGMRITR